MATLVLSVVGTALAGPVGGAIGALVGNAVDHAVLAPSTTREGPRLTQLAVQTSSYGNQIPALFGTMRVAGTVIWSTDLQETRSTSKAGKGQPTIASYAYSASLAVLLSARAVAGVGRIWADGNLLRGAGGDFKVPCGFRLHTGGEDQPVDPLLAAALGIQATPAHRGQAYAVFENLPLAGFGNRIPSLTFEVIADDTAPSIGAIAQALSGDIVADVGATLGGFAATGGSVGAVLDTLAVAAGGRVAQQGARAMLRDAAAAVPDGGIADDGYAAQAGHPRRARTIAAIEGVPRVVALSHYDPARDYQTGVQQARRPGAGTREQRVEIAAAIPADAAKTIAARILSRAEGERTARSVTMGLAGWALAPGDVVGIAGKRGRWRIADLAIENYAAAVSLRPVGPAVLAAAADAGRAVVAADEPIGQTILLARELPALDDAVAVAPRILVAANGTGRGWRRAALLLSLDDGLSWSAAGGTALPAVVGRVVEGGGAACGSALFDEAGAILVELARDDLTLADADDVRLDAGANLAWAGDELIQFGRAFPLGGARWRLSHLLRGRRGTEAAIDGTLADRPFALVEPDGVRVLDLSPSAIGGTVRLLATGAGDDAAPPQLVVAVTGASVAPPAPVHLVVDRGAAETTLSWTRRSRGGWRWLDGVDVPLAEEAEAYRVDWQGAGGGGADVAGPAAPLPPDCTTVTVRQRGTQALSSPAMLAIPGETA